MKSTLTLVVAINIWGAIPRFHYAPWEPLARDDVRVYTVRVDLANSMPEQTRIPIEMVDTTGFTNTGESVTAYIRSGFRDSGKVICPAITLAVAAIGWVVSSIVNRHGRRVP